MAKVLTAAAVEKATPGPKGRWLWDAATPGLLLKVQRSGSKLWAFRARFPGQKGQSARTLGAFPSLGLAEAREVARQWSSLVRNGTDPAEVEAAARRAREAAKRAEEDRAGNTFGPFAERWLASRTGRHAKQDVREMRKRVIAEWGNKPLSEIRPRDVRELMAKIVRTAPYDARSVWGLMGMLFKRAVFDELIEASPMASLDKRLVFSGLKFAPRQRVLSDDEVVAFIHATRRMGVAGSALQLLLLSGCRRNEIAGASWSELHGEMRRLIREAGAKKSRVSWSAVPASAKVLVIPRERFKSDAEHRVALSDTACELIERLPRFADTDLMFPGATWLGDKMKKRLDARMLRALKATARVRGDDATKVTLPQWQIHDLRRVVRSGLAGLGVDDRVAEMVLGHGAKGLARIYDRSGREPQIREAMERWAAHLASLGKPIPPAPMPTNVVPLRAGAA